MPGNASLNQLGYDCGDNRVGHNRFMSETAYTRAAEVAYQGSFLDFVRDEVRDSRFVYLFLALFVTATLVQSAWRGDEFLPLLGVYLLRSCRAVALLASAAFAVIAVQVLVERHDRPAREIGRRLRRMAANGSMSRFGFACTVLALFMAAFLYNKMLIPVLNPFDWDETFIAWDKALFGGHHPWQLLHPVLGYPAITLALDVVYTAWVPMVFVFWAGLLASEKVPSELRRRYWVTTMLSWVLIGLVMATVFSSAGPCFLPALLPEAAAPYRDLNLYLAELNNDWGLGSSVAKGFLWSAYVGAVGEPGGISAMPSMHNAQAALFAAVAYSINRRLGHVMLAYAALIFIASIHLAWHYAVDGIIGIAAALLVWFAVGAISGRSNRTRHQPA